MVLNIRSIPEQFRQPKQLVTSPQLQISPFKKFVFLFKIIAIVTNLKWGNISIAFINFSRGKL